MLLNVILCSSMLYYARQCYIMLLSVRLCSSMLYYAPQCYIMLLNVMLCPSMLYYAHKFDIMIPKIMQWSSMWCHSSHLITLSTTSFLFYSNCFLFSREYDYLKLLFLIIKIIFVPKNWLESFCTFLILFLHFFHSLISQLCLSTLISLSKLL